MIKEMMRLVDYSGEFGDAKWFPHGIWGEYGFAKVMFPESRDTFLFCSDIRLGKSTQITLMIDGDPYLMEYGGDDKATFQRFLSSFRKGVNLLENKKSPTTVQLRRAFSPISMLFNENIFIIPKDVNPV